VSRSRPITLLAGPALIYGHPLYLFVKDQNPGDVNGQGVSAFGASWFALSPAGNQDSAQQPTSSVGGGGSGGGY